MSTAHFNHDSLDRSDIAFCYFENFFIHLTISVGFAKACLWC